MCLKQYQSFGQVKILLKLILLLLMELWALDTDSSLSTGGPEKEEMSMISILSNPARQDRDHTSNLGSRGINRRTVTSYIHSGFYRS